MKRVNIFAKTSKGINIGNVPIEDQIRYVTLSAFVNCPYCEKEIRVLSNVLHYHKKYRKSIVMKCVEDDFEAIIPSQIFIKPGSLISQEAFFDRISKDE